MSSARLIAGRRGSCPRFPELTCYPPRWRVPFRTPTGPLKHPHALPKRDSVIDGTMRRPVAAAEARRSRSPNVADDVALMEGRVGKGGAQSLVGYPSENLWRVPICNYRAPIVGVGSSSREDTSSTQPSIKMLDEPARGIAFARRERNSRIRIFWRG